VPRVYVRRISVLAAVNLPLVNTHLPNTKCVISVNGVIKAKTIVILSEQAPVWPRVDLDLVVDKAHPGRLKTSSNTVF
jgi:hypothetical protein